MDAEVIKAAATSPLGILALLILVLSGLATAFFKTAPIRVKVLIFVLMLGAAVTFGAVVLRQPAAEAAQRDKDVTPEPRPPAELGGLLLPQSSQRQIQHAELAQLSPAQLRIARNEIYARHGLIFKAQDLRDHFGHFDWYRPTQAQVVLSPLEQQNIRTLQEEEKAR